MESFSHDLTNLFDQLGLASDRSSIDQFISAHRLNNAVRIADAPFWNRAQSAFIQEAFDQDSDWVEAVDELDSLLRK